MNELDDLVGGSSEYELSDLMPPVDYSLAPPKASIRNRAAQLSVFSGSNEETVSKYKTMMAEGEQGSSTYANFEQSKLAERLEKEDRASVISILGDPSISPQQKDFLVKNMRSGKVDTDPHLGLLSEFSKQGSQDETPEAEDARIGLMSKAIREIRDSNEKIQGIVNAHAASLDDADAGTVLEIAEYLVAPFGTNIATSTLMGEVEDNRTAWEKIKGFLLPGSEIKDLRERLSALPAEERITMSEKIAKALSRAPKTVFGHNQFAAYDKALQVFGEGGYSTTDEWLDNLGTLLDAVGLGVLVKPKKALKPVNVPTPQPGARKPVTGPSKPSEGPSVIDIDEADLKREPGTGGWYQELPSGTKRIEMEDDLKRIETNVTRSESPLSPHATAKQSNPQKAREFHETIVTSKSDEVSEALTGENATQSVINDVFPQAATESGKVTAQTADIQRNVRRANTIPERIKEYIFSAGRIDITPEEAATARANVVRRFNDAEGLRMEESMSSFTRDGGQIDISAMYGTSEGAFNNAQEAVDQAKAALKHLNLSDDEIVLMERQGRDYAPVKLEDASADGSFYIQVKTKHEIDPTDIVDEAGNVNFENFSVWGNIFDRLGVGFSDTFGSLQRHILDAQSMLDKRLTGAASSAYDRAAKLEEYLLGEATKFSDKYRELAKKEKLQVDQYLREANFKEIPFDQADLMARGFSPKMVETVKSWREYWDGVYYLENLDVIRTLRVQGYQKFKNANAEVYAKAVAKDRRNNFVYDPDSDAVSPISPDELDDLYNMGGTIARLRRPATFHGEVVEHIVVRNQGQSYLRQIRDSDTALNYKEGYYSIQYKAPRFVDEIVKDASGKSIRKAIAVAGDSVEAERFAKRMRRNSTNGAEYVVRGDDRALVTGSDDWFDVNSAGGRVSQRHRGKLLEDGAGLNHLGDGSYIVDPVASATRAARSISGRTVSRPMLEYAKARFMKQYGKYVTESDGIGGKRFPSGKEFIGAKGMQFTKEVADARTTWEYIRYLENGYINSVDGFFKAAMHSLSWSVGKAAAKRGSKAGAAIERGLEAVSEVRPTQAGKNFVFQAYIATNPLRQLIVQPHQILRTIAYNPQGWYSGSTLKYSLEHAVFLATGKRTPFIDFMDKSGALSAVDKQNLVRGSLFEAANQSNNIAKGAAKALSVPREYGFDIGERANMVGHYASVYDKYVREGKAIGTKEVAEAAYAEARALSYSMNFANDMPYNQNALGMALQFMQVPHKAMLQMTNRTLTPATRARLLGFDMLFWGGPTLLISELLGGDILPDNKELRESFVFGVESWMLNQAFRNVFKDENINIDFSSLAPYDMTGWKEFFSAVMEEGILSVLSNSPAGQLFGEQGRVATAVRSVLRYVGVTEQMEETPEQFQAVLEEVLSISSGFSNGMKAHLAMKTGERYDKYGQLIDSTTHPVEAVFEALGFSDANRRDLFAVSRELRKDVKKHREEVTKDSKELLNYLSRRLEGGTQDERQLEIIQRAMNFALSKYAGDPEAMDIFHQQLSLRMRDPNEGLALNLMKASGIPEISNLEDQIRMSPLEDEQKQKMLQVIQDMKNLRGE